MDVEEILKDALMKLGMWWPDADSGQLREAASAWRAFAEAVDDVTAVTHKSARSIIDGNEGQSIEAFGEFWARYHKGAKSGWFDDLAESARSMAKALDKYADSVDEAISHLRTEIGIAAAALGAGVVLAIVTGGAAAVVGSAAAEGVIAASASIGVAVSAEIAGVIGMTMSGVAFGAIESIAVDLAVAQPLHIAAGDQESISLEHAREAGVDGAVLGGALAGAGSSAAAIKDAGGLKTVLNSIDIPALNGAGPRLATVNGADVPIAGGGSGLDRHWLFSSWKNLPEEARKKIFAGNKFNKDNYGRYPANEVHLENGKRLDSYAHQDEIVSRKYSQLSEVKESTAKSYLNEIVEKYEPDTVIRSNKYPDLDGKPLEGQMILEVPVQKQPIPQSVVDHAADLDIVIRDNLGNLYN
ncbi:WXG100 family type VII secretion target [Streptomyces sp. NPDC102381]|uniref:WXG100 family type VII secretion target n=1 Tax=Streptomyces sp. NPDC102381 TaxID=3366164 RepID=UPI0037F5E579